MKTESRFLILLALLPALVAAFGGQSKPSGGKPAGDDSPDYREMSRILFRYRPGIDYGRLHSQYRERNPPAPLACSSQFTLMPVSGSAGSREGSRRSLSHILVIADAALYAAPRAREVIDRYLRDINAGYGFGVELLTVQGGSPEDLKSLLRGRYFLEGLAGAVFIGRLPAAWYEIANDHAWYQGGYGYADWTCDLFFMDLDGSWQDADANRIYDSHTAGPGDLEAEIFVGRIDTSAMGSYGTEVDLLCRYLDKDHAYWSGQTKLPHCGLAYIDHDWSSQGAGYFRNLYGPGNYQGLVWPGPAESPVGKTDYLANRLPSPYYGFTQIWTHASHEAHAFYTGGICLEQEVHGRNPRSIGYNIDGCHAGDWAAAEGRYFLSGGYVYNDSPSSLAAISTTKSGGMLAFNSFYLELGRNSCLGEAFLYWLNDRLASREDRDYVLCWHYGMTIVGDPLIAFLEVPGLEKPVEKAAPPLDFSGARQENRSLLFRQYLDVLTWRANPENDPAECLGYRLYEVAMDNLIRLADVGRDQLQYIARKPDNKPCLYAVATLDRSGAESEPALTTVK